MNLFMDDVRVCPPGWTLARTVKEAQAHLSTGTVDRCSLDHDMGPCEDCRDSTRTTCNHDGTYLVRWMVETGCWPKQKPTVHSDNPVGHGRMDDIIASYFGYPALGPVI